MRFCFALLGLIVATGAFAEDTVEDVAGELAVVERVSCADMSAQIKELSAIESPDEETIAELDKLNFDYRRMCSRNARGRKTSGREGVVETEAEPEIVQQDVAPKTEQVKPETAVETAKPELTSQQIKANLEAGLCSDGTKPNKFGCCNGEIFKDMGNNEFACCPKQGGDCFPPIK